MSTQPTNIPVSAQTAFIGKLGEYSDYEKRISTDWSFAMEQGDLFFSGKSEVHKTLKKLTSKLATLSIPHVVVGGLSLMRYGYVRYTDDIDLLVTRSGLKEIHEHLEGLGYKRLFAGSKGLRDAETGVKIDFLITGDYPGDGKPKEISFPSPDSVAEEFNGMQFISLPMLITLKLASGLSGNDRAKDIGDVEQLVKICSLSESFANQLPHSLQSAYVSLWRRVMAVKRYVLLWRNKWITSDAKSLDEMVRSLRAASDELESMLKDGVVLETDGGTADDYAHLMTTDPIVAQKYDMHPEEDFFDEAEDN